MTTFANGPFLHAFVQVEQQVRQAAIQAKGYDWHQVVQPQTPGSISIVVVADDHDEEDVMGAAMGAHQRIGSPMPTILFVRDRIAVEAPHKRTYFQAVQEAFDNDAGIRYPIARLIKAGGWFWGYEAPEPGLTVTFAQSLGFAPERIFNRVPLLDRLKIEVEPDRLVSEGVIPPDMVLTRSLVPSVDEAEDLIFRFRNVEDPLYHNGDLTIEPEIRSGGIRSARLRRGEKTNPALKDLFDQIKGRKVVPEGESITGESLIIDRIFPGEVCWSTAFVGTGEGGFERCAVHTKAWGLVGGRNLKLGSVQSFGSSIPGVPSEHLAMVQELNEKMAAGLYHELGYSGSLGLEWRSVPGQAFPLLHLGVIRTDSQIIAEGVLKAVERQLGKPGSMLCMHTRFYKDRVSGDQKPWRWTTLSKTLEAELYTREKGAGVILSPPYWDVGRQCRTLLLIQVGEDVQALAEQQQRVKALSGALTPEEWDAQYGAKTF